MSSSILYSLSLDGAALEEEESELLMVELHYLPALLRSSQDASYHVISQLSLTCWSSM